MLIISSIVLIYVAYRLYQHFFPSPNITPKDKYVLISGCDTGFGHGLAVALDQQGFNVLAAVYMADSVAVLKNKLSTRAHVFQLDVTSQDDIDRAYELTAKKTHVLHALVNNAGIGVSGYIDLSSIDVLRRTMDVNFFAHVAMTKKFLPLLVAERHSRVINLCSVAGFLSAPSISAYSASKYALESFSDCLRREMAPWGLHVCILEPGFMRTPIIDGINKSREDVWSTIASDAQTRWGKEFYQAKYGGTADSVFIKKAEDPSKVVHALEHAVMNSKPQIRYRPGWQSSLIFFPLSMLPAWLVDWTLIQLTKGIVVPAGVSRQMQE